MIERKLFLEIKERVLPLFNPLENVEDCLAVDEVSFLKAFGLSKGSPKILTEFGFGKQIAGRVVSVADMIKRIFDDFFFSIAADGSLDAQEFEPGG